MVVVVGGVNSAATAVTCASPALEMDCIGAAARTPSALVLRAGGGCWA